jgi:hypothetical protein
MNNRAATQFEIEWRKLLIKRLENPLKLLQAAQGNETQKAIEKTSKLVKFDSYEDAQEAYGYGDITMDELDRIKDMFDGAENKPEQTSIGAATDELFHIISRLRSDVRSFEWTLLPDEEKERIERASEERHAIVEIRRAER